MNWSQVVGEVSGWRNWTDFIRRLQGLWHVRAVAAEEGIDLVPRQ